MKSVRWLLLTGIVVWSLYSLLQPGEEERIRELLREMLPLAEVDSEVQLHPLEMAGNAHRLSSSFAKPAVVDFSNAGYRRLVLNNRREIAQKILQTKGALTSLELALRDFSVEIDDGHATVAVTGSALGALKGEKGQFLDIHRLRIQLINQQGDWMISEVVHVRNERGEPGP